MALRGRVLPRLLFPSRFGHARSIMRVSQAQEINRPTSPLVFREQKTGREVAHVTSFQSMNHLH